MNVKFNAINNMRGQSFELINTSFLRSLIIFQPRGNMRFKIKIANIVLLRFIFIT